MMENGKECRTCNPCQFCRHLVYSTGRSNCGEFYGYDECDADIEWDGNRPCPAFNPIPASVYLDEQIRAEEEYFEYLDEQVVEGIELDDEEQEAYNDLKRFYGDK